MEGLFHVVLADEGVEGSGEEDGVEGGLGGEVRGDEAFDHAAQHCHVSGADDLASVGVSEDDGHSVVCELEEVEVEAELFGCPILGNPDFELRPLGLDEGGEAEIGLLENFAQFDRLVGRGALTLDFRGFVVIGEVGDEGDGVLIALGGGNGEGFTDDSLEAGWKKGKVDHPVAEFAEDEFVGDHTECEDIRGKRGIGGVFFLLGTHIAGSAEDPMSDAGRLFMELGNPKVDYFDFTIFGDEDVFGLEVSVDHAVGVEMGEGVGNLKDNIETPLEGKGLLHEKLSQ